MTIDPRVWFWTLIQYTRRQNGDRITVFGVDSTPSNLQCVGGTWQGKSLQLARKYFKENTLSRAVGGQERRVKHPSNAEQLDFLLKSCSISVGGMMFYTRLSCLSRQRIVPAHEPVHEPVNVAIDTSWLCKNELIMTVAWCKH
jgi:hypothetical protein